VRRFGLERPDVVALVERAREVPSQEERQALYARALTEIHDEVPMLTLAHESKFLVVRTGVEGVVMNPLGGFPRLNNATKATN
jgi:ABC-type transport system substrate-binding protein